ncbi:MAG: flagellar biosynthesis protein FlhA [Deltaproteobacteria bacterium]|nr:flagellar biosynthesis protein FlhA [Deltaproteobacteria bacterium]
MADAIAVKRSYLSEMTKNSSAMLAMGVIGILLVMMVPLPTIILDILLSFSITISIIILLMSMYVLKPLDFSVFPSILLIVTLLRLSLNVASTRLILLHGNEGTGAAGQVIKAFGTFVVGGNYVVGIIVFSVLVLINFVVITKGATRIAEVAARFTLDAMPGKQMSIDADLNTGLISDTEARRRRREIENEANFYGAMDGASKFVRGDAIAGIIIVLVNIIGGLIVGVLQKGMPIVDAARTYTLLTVGDGLVTQVPALIVSTAAGMLVTRTTASAELGEELKKQLFTQPKTIALSAIMLFSFAMIPGMPKVSFIIVAAFMAFLSYRLFQSEDNAAVEKEEPPAPVADTSSELLVPLDTLGLEVGYGLISLVDTSQGGELLHRIKSLRKQLANEMGFIMPAVHIRDNLQLKPNEYSFLMKGIEIARGELIPDHSLAIVPEEAGGKVTGIPTREPAFGLPAVWIPERDVENAQAKGLVVVDAATVMTTHITEIVKSHVDELLGRQEVQAIIDSLSTSYPRVVEDLVPKVIPLGTLQKVLQRLLKERVSIRDMLMIIETLADYLPMTKNIDILTGYVRQSLARTITRQYEDRDHTIHVIMVSPEIEEIISRSVQHTEHESFVSPDPGLVRKFIENTQKFVGTFASRGLPAIVLSSANTRIHLRKIMERFFPNIVVLAHNEITADTNITSLGMVEI